MRRWLLLGLAVAVVVLAAPARSSPFLQTLLGLAVLGLLAVALSYLPWRRWLSLPTMPGTFTRPGPGEVWCTGCGRPRPAAGCPSCAPRKAKRQAPNSAKPLRKRA